MEDDLKISKLETNQGTETKAKFMNRFVYFHIKFLHRYT